MATNPNPSVTVDSDVAKMLDLLKNEETASKPLVTSTAPKPTIPTYSFPGVKQEDYAPYFEQGFFKYNPGTTEKERAQNQPWTQQAPNALARGVAGGVASIAQYTGNMLDFEDYYNQDKEVGNWLSDAIDTWKQETLNPNFPIYRENPNKSLDFGDSAYWFENGASLVDSAIGFVGAGFGVGKGLQAMNWLSSLGKSAEFTSAWGKGLSTFAHSAITNQAESVQIGAQVWKDSYQSAIENGLSEEEAKTIASEAASYAVNINRFNIALNLYSSKWFIKQGGGRNLLKDISVKNTLKTAGYEGLNEYGEETVNYFGEQEGKRQAQANIDGTEYDFDFQRMFSDAFTKEGFEQGMLGFLGGMGQTIATKGAFDRVPINKTEEGWKSNTTLHKEQYTKQQAFLQPIQAALKNSGLKDILTTAQTAEEIINSGLFVQTIDELLTTYTSKPEADKIAFLNEQAAKITSTDKNKAALEKAKLLSFAKLDKASLKKIGETTEANLLAVQTFNALNLGAVEGIENIYKEALEATPEQSKDWAPDYKLRAEKALKLISEYEKIYDRYAGQYSPTVVKNLYELNIQNRELDAFIDHYNQQINELVAPKEKQLQELALKSIGTTTTEEVSEENQQSGYFEKAKEDIDKQYKALTKPYQERVDKLTKQRTENLRAITNLQSNRNLQEVLEQEELAKKLGAQKKIESRVNLKPTLAPYIEDQAKGGRFAALNGTPVTIVEQEDGFYTVRADGTKETLITPENVNKILSTWKSSEQFKQEKEIQEKEIEIASRLKAMEAVVEEKYKELEGLHDQTVKNEKEIKALTTRINKLLSDLADAKITSQIISESGRKFRQLNLGKAKQAEAEIEKLIQETKDLISNLEQQNTILREQLKGVEESILFMTEYIAQSKQEKIDLERMSAEYKLAARTILDEADISGTIPSATKLLKEADDTIKNLTNLKDWIAQAISNNELDILFLDERIKELESTLQKHQDWEKFLKDAVENLEVYIRTVYGPSAPIQYSTKNLMEFAQWRISLGDQAGNPYLDGAGAEGLLETLTKLEETRQLRKETLALIESIKVQPNDNIPFNTALIQEIQVNLQKLQDYYSNVSERLERQKRARDIIELYQKIQPLFPFFKNEARKEQKKAQQRANQNKNQDPDIEAQTQNPKHEPTLRGPVQYSDNEPKKIASMSSATNAFVMKNGKIVRKDGIPVFKDGGPEVAWTNFLSKLTLKKAQELTVQFEILDDNTSKLNLFSPREIIAENLNKFIVEHELYLSKNYEEFTDSFNKLASKELIDQKDEFTEEQFSMLVTRIMELGQLNLSKDQMSKVTRGIKITLYRDGKVVRINQKGEEALTGEIAQSYLMAPLTVYSKPRGADKSYTALARGYFARQFAKKNKKLSADEIEEMVENHLRKLREELINYRIDTVTKKLNGETVVSGIDEERGLSYGILNLSTIPHTLKEVFGDELAEIEIATTENHVFDDGTIGQPGQAFAVTASNEYYPIDTRPLSQFDNFRTTIDNILKLIVYTNHVNTKNKEKLQEIGIIVKGPKKVSLPIIGRGKQNSLLNNLIFWGKMDEKQDNQIYISKGMLHFGTTAIVITELYEIKDGKVIWNPELTPQVSTFLENKLFNISLPALSNKGAFAELVKVETSDNIEDWTIEVNSHNPKNGRSGYVDYLSNKLKSNLIPLSKKQPLHLSRYLTLSGSEPKIKSDKQEKKGKKEQKSEPITQTNQLKDTDKFSVENLSKGVITLDITPAKTGNRRQWNFKIEKDKLVFVPKPDQKLDEKQQKYMDSIANYFTKLFNEDLSTIKENITEDFELHSVTVTPKKETLIKSTKYKNQEVFNELPGNDRSIYIEEFGFSVEKDKGGDIILSNQEYPEGITLENYLKEQEITEKNWTKLDGKLRALAHWNFVILQATEPTSDIKAKKADTEKQVNSLTEKMDENSDKNDLKKQTISDKLTKDILPKGYRATNGGGIIEKLENKKWVNITQDIINTDKDILKAIDTYFNIQGLGQKLTVIHNEYNKQISEIKDQEDQFDKAMRETQSQLLQSVIGIELRRDWSFGKGKPYGEENSGIEENDEESIKKDPNDKYWGVYYFSLEDSENGWTEIIYGTTEEEVKNKINTKYDAELDALETKTETKGEIKLGGKLGKKLQGQVSTDKSTIKTEGTNPNPQEDPDCPF